MTKEQCFAEIKVLEAKAFNLINDDDQQDEFDRVMDRTAELVGTARENGWLA